MSISVIIPAHNEEKEIGQTIQNIHHVLQNINYEIIVVCDYCTDKTSQICSENGVDIILNVKNKNIAKNRNLGASVSSNKYLLFLDADTRITSKLMVLAMDKIQDTKIAVVGHYWDGENKNVPANYVFEQMTNSFLYLTDTSPGFFLLCRRTQFLGFNDTVKVDDVDFVDRMKRWGEIYKLSNTGLTTSMRRVEDKGLIAAMYHYASKDIFNLLFKYTFLNFVMIVLIIVLIIVIYKKFLKR